MHTRAHCPSSQRLAPVLPEGDSAAQHKDTDEVKEDESDASSVKSPHVQRGGKRRRDTHADKVIAASTASIDRLTSVVERTLQGLSGLAQASTPGVPAPPPMQPNQDRNDYFRALSAFYAALATKPAQAP